MATKFLRKIILEELNKVLKEQAGLDVWKSAKPDNTTVSELPDIKIKSLTPQQKYKLAVKGLQKQLKRVAGLDAHGLEVNGQLDAGTRGFLGVLYPGLENNWHKALKTTKEVEEYTKGLKRTTPQEYQVASSKYGSTSGIATSKSPADVVSQSNKTPTKDPDDLLPTQKISPETQKEKERREAVNKSTKEKIGSGPLGQEPPPSPFEEQKESIVREIKKLLRKI